MVVRKYRKLQSMSYSWFYIFPYSTSSVLCMLKSCWKMLKVRCSVQGTEWLQPTGRWGPLPLRTAWMCCLAAEHAVRRTNVMQHHGNGIGLVWMWKGDRYRTCSYWVVHVPQVEYYQYFPYRHIVANRKCKSKNYEKGMCISASVFVTPCLHRDCSAIGSRSRHCTSISPCTVRVRGYYNSILVRLDIDIWYTKWQAWYYGTFSLLYIVFGCAWTLCSIYSPANSKNNQNNKVQCLTIQINSSFKQCPM